MNFLFYIDEETVRRERMKARDLRLSPWWINQLGKSRCHYCEQCFSPKLLTMDHKVPISKGGKSTRNNVVACCKACNTEKKDMTLSEWIAKRQEENNPLPCARLELY